MNEKFQAKAYLQGHIDASENIIEFLLSIVDGLKQTRDQFKKVVRQMDDDNKKPDQATEKTS